MNVNNSSSHPLDQTVHTINCKQRINKNEKNIKCISCKNIFHRRCHKVYSRTRYQTNNWKCWNCLSIKRINCKKCKKTIARNLHPVQCRSCQKNFHKKCARLPLNKTFNNWTCHDCTGLEFPFCKLSNEEFLGTINGIDNIDETKLNLLPSFSLQTLLDKISNAYIETGEFESETVNSKYYSPIDFLARKFPKSKFSILHLNIVSIQSRINELRELLAFLDFPFDLIEISETKLKTDCDIAVNIDLDGYDLEKNTNRYIFWWCSNIY